MHLPFGGHIDTLAACIDGIAVHFLPPLAMPLVLQLDRMAVPQLEDSEEQPLLLVLVQFLPQLNLPRLALTQLALLLEVRDPQAQKKKFIPIFQV